MQPQVSKPMIEILSKQYFSYVGWTTRGGKRGFFEIVAHFADDARNLTEPRTHTSGEFTFYMDVDCVISPFVASSFIMKTKTGKSEVEVYASTLRISTSTRERRKKGLVMFS
jgi:hypothetical protein